jgi:hypothetical protein
MFRHINLEKDPPPQLEPSELPSPEQMGRIARELLREMAQYTPEFESRIYRAGIRVEN